MPPQPISQIVYHRRAHPEATVEDALRAFRPDTLIMDAQMASFVVDAWETDDPYRLQPRVPRRELDAFLAHRGQLAADFGGLYGRSSVFRMRWEQQQ